MDILASLRGEKTMSAAAVRVVLLSAAMLFSMHIETVRATEQAQKRQAARGERQDTRQNARDTKQNCVVSNQQSNASCRQDKRQSKQQGRETARDIKY
jgi:hypothetical protein